jgi:hypothetical protein
MCHTWPAHFIVLDLTTLIKLVKCTSYEAPHYEVFSNLLPFSPSYVHIFSSAPCSQTVFFLQCERPSFTPIQNRYNYSHILPNNPERDEDMHCSGGYNTGLLNIPFWIPIIKQFDVHTLCFTAQLRDASCKEKWNTPKHCLLRFSKEALPTCFKYYTSRKSITNPLYQTQFEVYFSVIVFHAKMQEYKELLKTT